MESNVENADKSIREFSPSKRPYLVFFLILFPLMIMTFSMFLRRNDTGALFGSVFCLVFLLAMWIWIFNNRLIFNSHGVTHGTFSWFRRYLAFSDIDDFYTFVGFRDDRGRTGPFIRLVIESKPESGKKAIMVAFRLFSGPDQLKIIELLSDKFPDHKIQRKKHR